MDIRKQAAVNVVKGITFAILCGIAVGLIFNLVPIQYIGIGVATVMLAYAIRFVYQVEVDRLARLEALNKSVDK